VDPHPHANGDAVRPRLRGKGALRRYCGGDRVPGARERDEDGIALRVDLVAAELLNCLAEQTRMRRQNIVVLVAELLQQPRRPSISVKRNETVPVGRSGISTAPEEKARCHGPSSVAGAGFEPATSGF
jgi:hypothetical protein